LLGELTDGPGDARRVWEALEIEAQRLAEERSFLHRDGLVRRLEMREIRLRPLARLRPDIQRLRDRTRLNMQVPGVALTIAAPETAVALSREIGPAIANADGNLAITGAPGTGKTVLLYGLAAAQATADIDLVVLNSENLGATAGQTRDELNITHDLADVLAGWTGSRPGLLLIDGLDQA
jgi:DNA replication protein DnaC